MNLNSPRVAQSAVLKSLIIGLVLLAPFIAYFATAHSIVFIWNSSETFAHGYIILPISLWLIWRRRHILAELAIEPYWPAFALLAICGLGWLLAELGDVQIVKQYAFAAMLPISALAILGKQIARAIAFPLAFILFAVPFGDIFIAPLIDITANFTVDALRATGIPVLREGNSFSIPTGNWSVVEACSGIRYLISSFTLGCLYAYLTYRSPWRRALFVLLSIIVPIGANGVRAYMIVMIGHLSGMTLAVGFDHLIYGWIFFGLVMFLLFWLGSFWREEPYHTIADPAEKRTAAPVRPTSITRLGIAALGIVICISIWPAYARYLEAAEFNPASAQLSGFQATWPATTPFSSWKPAFSPSNAELRQFYEKNGHPIGLSLLYYRNQQHGAELISSTNLLVQTKDPAFRRIDANLHSETILNHPMTLREARIAGPSGHLLVWYWYWIDGKTTSNDYIGKILQVEQKFLHGSDDSAAVMIFAPYDEKPDEARLALHDFLVSNLAPIDDILASNKKQ